MRLLCTRSTISYTNLGAGVNLADWNKSSRSFPSNWPWPGAPRLPGSILITTGAEPLARFFPFMAQYLKFDLRLLRISGSALTYLNILALLAPLFSNAFGYIYIHPPRCTRPVPAANRHDTSFRSNQHVEAFLSHRIVLRRLPRRGHGRLWWNGAHRSVAR